MRPASSRRLWMIAVPVVAACLAAVVVVVISDDDASDGPVGTVEPAGDFPAPSPNAGPRGEGNDSAASREDPESAAIRAARGYLEGIDARDGPRVCELLVPGAIEGLELPQERADCAASLDASIGYRDPRGFPVFDRARVESIHGAAVAGERATVTATVITRFADRAEPSIEEDVIYLV